MYPQWQGVVTMGALFGALQVVWDTLVWIVAIARRLWRLDAERYAVVMRVLEALERPEWARARQIVREGATTPRFHAPEQWIALNRIIKANRGQAQNMFRHLQAVHALRGLEDGAPGLSNPDAHLVIELAYQGMAATGGVRKPARIIAHPVLHRKGA